MSDSHLVRVFEGPTEMRWGDLDAYGHVNNVRFFDYFQEARIIWLTRAQVSMDDPLCGFVVVHISCDFLRELCYPKRLWSMIDVVKTGRSSITLQQSVADFSQREILYGKGRTTMAWRDHQSGRSTAMTDELTARLLKPQEQD